MQITIKNESFILGYEKILFWPKHQLLVIADLHLGRAFALQSKGISLPEGSDNEDLKEITKILIKYSPHTVVLLGDIFHSKIALNSEIIIALKEILQPVKNIIAIIGNHDRAILKKFPLVTENFKFCNSYKLDGFGFCHDFSNNLDSEIFWWSGHVHPRVSLKYGPDSLKLPAFVIKKDNGILPAFSRLAVGFTIKKSVQYERFACAPNEIILIDKK